MLCLPAAALLLLPAWFGGPVLGELSANFSQCLQFFYEAAPPRGLGGPEHQPICQRYRNKHRFASLYHRPSRTPLYSAYRLNVTDGKRPRGTWMYEPQLAFSGASAEMEAFNVSVDQNVMESQAVLEDYRNSSFTKGHLNPSMHQGTKEDRKATFTLTNIVPQKKGSNSGPWNRLEAEVLGKFREFCKGSMYVITGVIPYASNDQWINNRVSVPEYMWSAYCCPLADGEHRAHAAVGRNDPKSGEEIVPLNANAKASVRGYDVKKMSVSALEDILNERLDTSVSLFNRKCE